MNRYKFAQLYIKLARGLAVIVLLVMIAIGLSSGIGQFFFVSLINGLMLAFAILVGADLVACFLQIEKNTRQG
jgi:ABC-type amino acid transport system permease subunit